MPIKFNDVGKRFGKLVILSKDESEEIKNKIGGNIYYICKCDCGNTISLRGSRVRKGQYTSCGCDNNEKSNRPYEDLTGKRFGKLVVIKRDWAFSKKAVKWVCKCDCGNEVSILSNNLKRGASQSCGCIFKEYTRGLVKENNPAFKDETGNKYGKLTVLRLDETSKRVRWICKCDCGNEISLLGTSLRHGSKHKNISSCGCYAKEMNALAKGQAAFNRLYGSYKKSAKERGLVFELTEEEFKELTQQNCYYCNRKPYREFISGYFKGEKRGNGTYIYNGIDRVDNTKGYTKDNVVPCCKDCNMMKRDMEQKEFFNFIERVYNYWINNERNETGPLNNKDELQV